MGKGREIKKGGKERDEREREDETSNIGNSKVRMIEMGKNELNFDLLLGLFFLDQV